MDLNGNCLFDVVGIVLFFCIQAQTGSRTIDQRSLIGLAWFSSPCTMSTPPDGAPQFCTYKQCFWVLLSWIFTVFVFCTFLVDKILLDSVRLLQSRGQTDADREISWNEFKISHGRDWMVDAVFAMIEALSLQPQCLPQLSNKLWVCTCDTWPHYAARFFMFFPLFPIVEDLRISIDFTSFHFIDYVLFEYISWLFIKTPQASSTS